MRRIIYQEIATQLRQKIESGEYPRGGVLPSESALCQSFDASRVTVRKALGLLRDDGLIESQQGFGWIVSGEPLTQSLDALVSIERQLSEAGRPIDRTVTDFGFVDTPNVAAALGKRALEVGRLNVVDDVPFSRIIVWCRDDIAGDLSRSQVTDTSFLDLLGDQLTRAVQTIGAHAMPAAEAKLLKVPEASPALLVRRTIYDASDAALVVSEHWFPGHLTEFVAELTAQGQHDSGLRLVSEA